MPKINWSHPEDLGHLHTFQVMLRIWMEEHPKVRFADVLLCTGPSWLCSELSMRSLKPVVVLDQLTPTEGIWPQNHNITMLMETFFGNVINDLKSGPPLRGLVVRDEMRRAYKYGFEGIDGHAWPFVSSLSLYISARYPKCTRGASVLVMRPGSLHPFAASLRGRLFWATLLQFETPSAPWRFRLLHLSRERLSFAQLANHRAAVWIHTSGFGKATLKDLQVMEIPIFAPGRLLQASISGYGRCNKFVFDTDNISSWTYLLCRELAHGAQIQTMSGHFRYPHIVHFVSVTDLVWQLARRDCDEMDDISRQMRVWNAMLVAEDEGFWRDVILGLRAWHRSDFRPPLAGDLVCSRVRQLPCHM